MLFNTFFQVLAYIWIKKTNIKKKLLYNIYINCKLDKVMVQKVDNKVDEGGAG